MLELLLKNLNVNYFITDKENKVLFSSSDEVDFKLIMGIIKKNGEVNQIADRFYKCGRFEDDQYYAYYYQDVTDIVSKYQDLRKDGLTKLLLRRAALPLLDEYIKSSKSTGETYTIVMGDIVLFKNVNDTYGHDMGDKVLQQVAALFLHSFRTRDNLNIKDTDNKRHLNGVESIKDIICRYGGEEFLVLIKNASLDDSLKRIEVLRKKIEEVTMVTMSFGLLNVTKELESSSIFEGDIEIVRNNLIKIADECLYESKHNGRNLISYYSNGKISSYCPDGKRLVKNK